MSTLACSRPIAALFTTLCLLMPVSGPLHAEGSCPAEPVATPLALPHLRSAVNNGVEGVIVALGSSSTQGAMASNLGHSYPAVLQEVLGAGLPASHVAVINRGIGGQDAAEELARIETDVLAIRPQVAIWQVGANGALRNVDPAIFRTLVTEGVRRLQAAGVDVILMDNQQSPRLLAKADEAVFDKELAEVAAETGATLFSRRALMRAWRSEGFAFADFIAVDGLHHNDHGYFCVAQTLAKSILAGLKQPSHPLTASR
jgi:lysophospholipase L1-like esterase